MSRLAPATVVFLLVVALLSSLGGIVLLGLTWSTPVNGDVSSGLTTCINILVGLAFSLVGALITYRRPQNRIGWLFLIGGVYSALGTASERYIIYGLITEPGSLPAANLTASLGSAGWLLRLTQVVLLLILFPSGKAVSRFWRWVSYLVLVASAVAYGCFTLQPGKLPVPFQDIDNVLGVAALDGIEAGGFVGLLSLFLLTLISTIGIISRFARSSGEEREQFKWFVYAVAFIPALILAHTIAETAAPETIGVIESLFGLIVILMPVAVGFAVLKYRLYDIDILIKRTLVYVPLTAIVIGLYTALVGLFKTIATEVTDTNTDAAVAITTVLIVTLLTPLKNQIQAIVDRYFKEETRPAAELDRIAGQARSVLQVIDVNAFSRRMLDDLTRVLGASGARLEFSDASLSLSSGDSEGPWAISLPVVHDGRELAVLALAVRQDGRPYDSAECEALERALAVLAHGLSLDIRARRAAAV